MGSNGAVAHFPGFSVVPLKEETSCSSIGKRQSNRIVAAVLTDPVRIWIKARAQTSLGMNISSAHSYIKSLLHEIEIIVFKNVLESTYDRIKIFLCWNKLIIRGLKTAAFPKKKYTALN